SPALEPRPIRPATLIESEAPHAGMYAHDSKSSVTNPEWITIHVLSDVQVMMPSTQATILTQSLHQRSAATCDIGHSKSARSEIFLPAWARGSHWAACAQRLERCMQRRPRCRPQMLTVLGCADNVRGRLGLTRRRYFMSAERIS